MQLVQAVYAAANRRTDREADQDEHIQNEFPIRASNTLSEAAITLNEGSVHWQRSGLFATLAVTIVY